MSRRWTTTETDILQALTLKVRVLTDIQLSAGWWDDKLDEVESGMQPLCDVGLVERLQVFAHPMIELYPPAWVWKQSDPPLMDDKAAELAEFFQGRWTEAEIPHTVYVATKAAATLLGSHVSEPPKDSQWTHDIHTSQLYVDMKKTNPPEKMQQVIGEGALPKLGFDIEEMKDPDMFVVDKHQQAELVIEFAGAYDKDHVMKLHKHCAGDAHRKLKLRFPDRQYRLYPDPKGTPYLLI